MALVLGTNSGFVTTAPVADPSGGASQAVDGTARVTKDTSPAGSVRITEIGWWRNSGTDTANFEVGLYAADGAVVPGEAGTLLYVDATNSSSATGWLTVAVDWAISASTDYWIGLQMDAHTGSSVVDLEASGGAGADTKTTQTTLTDPFGGGALGVTGGMVAIYALVEISTPSESISPSISPSVSISPSSSPSTSPSASISPSTSPSVSISPSTSPSTSISPSVSLSQSPSASPSPSPAPESLQDLISMGVIPFPR